MTFLKLRKNFMYQLRSYTNDVENFDLTKISIFLFF